MNLQKKIIFGIFILLLLASAVLISFGVNNVYSAKSSQMLSKYIEKEKLNDLRLTIYYMSPYILTLQALSVDDLIDRYYEHKIVVDGSRLEEHVDLINQMVHAELIPAESEDGEPLLDARLYYMFETKRGRKIFDVSMWGVDYRIFVNGLEVNANDIFYKIVMPFLSEDLANELEYFATRGERGHLDWLEDQENQSE